MSLQLSTALRDKLMEHIASAATIIKEDTGISFTASTKTVAGGAGDFSAVQKGKKVTIATQSGTNDGTYNVDSVASDGSSFVTEESLTDESAGTRVTVMQASGGSFSDIFRNGVMRIFQGTQPGPDASESGSTLLVEISISSQDFDTDPEANGINLGDSVSGVIGKKSGEVWSGVAVATGTAQWFRFYDNSKTTGGSGINFDGTISTSGAQLNMSNTSITVDGTTTIDSVAIELPTL